MGGGQDTGCSSLGLHAKKLPTKAYKPPYVESKLPIAIKVEFNNETGRGRVLGKIELNFRVELLAVTELEIEMSKKLVKTKLSDQMIKLVLQEIERRVTPKAPLAMVKWYVTPNITKGIKLIIVHPEKLYEENVKNAKRS